MMNSKIMRDKRGTALIHVVVGLMLIGGGTLYLIGQPLLGGLVASMSLVIEIAINYARSLT